jgi:FMN phosphatase YigB (HAD superfamily)
MKIFIDFDDVLFNTKDFKNNLLDVFVNNGITKKQFKESCWGKTYNLKKQIEFIENNYDIDASKLEGDIEIFLKNLKGYVFTDVHGFIKDIGKENIFLISYGHKKFQEKKIKKSKLSNYFKRCVVTKDKPKAIAEILKEESVQDENIYFLDDRAGYIEEVKKNIPEIKTILMKRPEGRYDDESDECCDHVAKNLREAEEIISKNS